jgi:hypothetical protein
MKNFKTMLKRALELGQLRLGTVTPYCEPGRAEWLEHQFTGNSDWDAIWYYERLKWRYRD